ncbi:hypothetical protein [Jiangella asiatica]|uniref:TPM domain-containing protein n=1 Tax=Jiangella asiatica TaxID=2530372 RepID=A0A4R5DB48_9ACTN|nr:hypothetical protein [Jiangella asiatica]TDE10906.1 hypothetical protein E1269_10495 [Jiangella asiatica]
MRLTLTAALLALAGTGLAAAPAAVELSGPAPADGHVADVLAGWESAPVFVDPGQRSIVSDDDAQRLTARVEGQDPPTYIAVVPAVALSDMPGGSNDERGRAFLDALADAGAPDGAYLVVFGGAATYGMAVGIDAPVGPALDAALDRYTRSHQVAVLDDVLTELGLPGAPAEDGSGGWVVPVLVVVAVLAVLAGALLWWRRRRRQGAGGAAGPAPYRPSFEVLDDETDSLAERQQLAREDVTRFGEELDAADLAVDDPTVAADVQSAMDAYAEAGSAVDDAPDDTVLRAVRATVEYGRWRLACGRARLAGQPPPARRADCFFDQRHGVSVTDWMYTPAGGRAREVPICAACRDRLTETHR